MSPTVYQDNLQRLLHEIGNYSDFAQNNESVRTATRMPLANSFHISVAQSVFQLGALCSRQELVRRGLVETVDPNCTEARLGTADCVFTYTGPFRHTPSDQDATGIGILFAPAIEARDDPVATPFDSGAVFDYLRPHDDLAAQIAFVRSHELPVPDYRTLLAAYLRTVFTKVLDYVSGVGPCEAFPVAVEEGDARRWTFEVRFEAIMPVDGNVLAAFIPVDILLPDVLAQRVRWEAQGVSVIPYKADTPSSLLDAGVRFLEMYLS